MSVRDEKNLKFILAGIVVILLALGGGWFWAFRVKRQTQEEIDTIRQTNDAQEKKQADLRKQIDDYEREGTRDYYYRMLPDAEDQLPAETMRIFADIEEAAGVYILSGQPSKQSGKKKPGAAPYLESALTLRIYTDYLGLTRFVEGIEKEVDRKPMEGGGRLFEVLSIKPAKGGDKEEGKEGSTSMVPGWQFYDLDVVFFTRPGKKT